jgi:hypothetical protein
MPPCDVDQVVIKCSVPGNESCFQNYINERHVSALPLILWYICSSWAKIVPWRVSVGCIGLLLPFFKRAGDQVLACKTNSPDFLDSISN